MWSYSIRNDGAGYNPSQYKPPRDMERLEEWVASIDGLQLHGNLGIDEYTYSLECLVLDLDRRVRELEAKAKE